MDVAEIKVYTIGYARWSLGEVTELVDEKGSTLVDVRLKPYSRKPGFSRRSLEKELGDDYVHLPGFGNVNYKGGAVKLKEPESALARIADFVADGDPVMLMCGCADHRRCHRSAVAAAIQKR